MKICTKLLLASWAFCAYAAPVDSFDYSVKRVEPFSVQLTSAGNSAVNVTVMNNSATALNLLKTGTLLDDKLPVERLSLYTNGSATKVPFQGITGQFALDNLSADNFLVLEAGDKKELTIEAASLHNLSNGGDFDVLANGILEFANANSTQLVGSLAYKSNKLSISFNGTEAAIHKPDSLLSRKIRGGYHDKGCDTQQMRILDEARKNCYELSWAAADAAINGDPRLITFFKSDSQAVKEEVAARFRATALACRDQIITFSCKDKMSWCDKDHHLALYYGGLINDDSITFCPMFFWRIRPKLDGWIGPGGDPDGGDGGGDDDGPGDPGCGSRDQGTFLTHEMTHSPTVYNPPTKHHTSRYKDTIEISIDFALENGDSYSGFANWVRRGCYRLPDSDYD